MNDTINTDILMLACADVNDFKIKFIRENLVSDADVPLLADVFMMAAYDIYRIVGGKDYAAERLYAAADHAATFGEDDVD